MLRISFYAIAYQHSITTCLHYKMPYAIMDYHSVYSLIDSMVQYCYNKYISYIMDENETMGFEVLREIFIENKN